MKLLHDLFVWRLQQAKFVGKLYAAVGFFEWQFDSLSTARGPNKNRTRMEYFFMLSWIINEFEIKYTDRR